MEQSQETGVHIHPVRIVETLARAKISRVPVEINSADFRLEDARVSPPRYFADFVSLNSEGRGIEIIVFFVFV